MNTEMARVSARLLLLPIFIVAIGVMVKGYADVGDGFSAGVIASLAIGLQLMVFGSKDLQRLPLAHLAPRGIVLGLFIALLTAFVPALRGKPLFTHEPAPAAEVIHFGTLEILTAVAFDVGVFLIVFGFGVGVMATLSRSEARLRRAGRRQGMPPVPPASGDGAP